MATVITDDAGPIRIVLGGSGAGRLFGVPFLIVGLWLGRYLVLGFMDFATGVSGAEMIPGTILLVIVTAAFFLPGWMLLALRAIVEIDRTSGTVTVVRDLRFYRHRHMRRLTEFTRLEVDVLTLAHGRRLSSLLGLPVEDYRYTERPTDE